MMFDLKKAIILDTETTGLGAFDEVVEISVIEAATGEMLFDELLRPKQSISHDAQRVNQISNEELLNKRRFHEIAPRLQGLLAGKIIIGWNVGFDLRLIKQTAIQQRCATVWLGWLETYDLKQFYAERNGLNWDSVSLLSACQDENIKTDDLTPHRALADCQLTYRLFEKIR